MKTDSTAINVVKLPPGSAQRTKNYSRGYQTWIEELFLQSESNPNVSKIWASECASL